MPTKYIMLTPFTVGRSKVSDQSLTCP